MLAWQVFGILTRWLSGLALGWAFSLLWPKRKSEITWIVAMFLVYPGFLQQYVPMTYSHMFIVQAMFFVSLGLMLLAIRRNPRVHNLRRSGSLPLTILVAVLSWFSLEYFTRIRASTTCSYMAGDLGKTTHE